MRTLTAIGLALALLAAVPTAHATTKKHHRGKKHATQTEQKDAKTKTESGKAPATK